MENTRDSARELGYDVPNRIKKKAYVAKQKCKRCFGTGVLTVSFPGNKGSTKIDRIYCKCVTEIEIEVDEDKDSI